MDKLKNQNLHRQAILFSKQLLSKFAEIIHCVCKLIVLELSCDRPYRCALRSQMQISNVKTFKQRIVFLRYFMITSIWAMLWIANICFLLLPLAKESRQGSVFTAVCHSACRGVSGRHPHGPWQTPPGQTPQSTHRQADTPKADTLPDQTSPPDRHPPADGYCSEWYASYLNAFLL